MKTRDDRFFEKINKSDDCWFWIGSIKAGYPQFWDGHFVVYGHRWSYSRFVGPIPEGHQINHKCRNKTCVRPEHLEALSQADHFVVDQDLHIINGRTNGLSRKKTDLPEGVYYVDRERKYLASYIRHPETKKQIYLGSGKSSDPETINRLIFLYQRARKELISGELD